MVWGNILVICSSHFKTSSLKSHIQQHSFYMAKMKSELRSKVLLYELLLMRAPVNRASSFFSFLMSKLIKLILLLICCPSLSVWHGGISPLVNLFLLKSTLTRSDQFLFICFLTCWHLQRDTSASETKNKKVENALSSFCLSSLQLLKSDEVSIMFSFLFFTFFFFFFFCC